jgi:glycosyltransferase AglD
MNFSSPVLTSGETAWDNEPIHQFARSKTTGTSQHVGPQVLVTLPVHNEEAMLYGSVHFLVHGLNPAAFQYRLSIAEDGSADGTLDVISKLKKEFPDLIVRSSPVRQGRGSALRQLWSEIDADIYVFADADLAAGPEALIRVVNQIDKGAEVATGSRYCTGAIVRRPLIRDLVSRVYNRLVRSIFHDVVRDHQCGLKAFSREAKLRLMAMTREESWAWDTEVMVMASLSGMRVAEVPIEWEEYRTTRTPMRRLFSDIYLHGLSLIRLRNNLKRKRRQGNESSLAVSIARSDGVVVPPGRGSELSR